MGEKHVNNLIEIRHQTSTLELLETIKKGEQISVGILPSSKGKELIWKRKCVFVFDACIRGNETYNATSVIRDLLKHHHPDGHWTRKNVESLVLFQQKNAVDCIEEADDGKEVENQ